MLVGGGLFNLNIPCSLFFFFVKKVDDHMCFACLCLYVSSANLCVCFVDLASIKSQDEDHSFELSSVLDSDFFK